MQERWARNVIISPEVTLQFFKAQVHTDKLAMYMFITKFINTLSQDIPIKSFYDVSHTLRREIKHVLMKIRVNELITQ